MKKIHALQATHGKKHEILHSKLEQTKNQNGKEQKKNTTARFFNSLNIYCQRLVSI